MLPGGCGTASLGFLEGRAAGVAASGIEGVTGVAELPVLSELGCFSLVWQEGKLCHVCLVGFLMASRAAQVPDL